MFRLLSIYCSSHGERSYSVTLCLKQSKVCNSYKLSMSNYNGIKALKQAQLHVMTNNLPKYEHIRFYHMVSEELFTKSYYVTQCIKQSKSPITPTTFFFLNQNGSILQQGQLHVMTSNPTKYEHIPSYCFRGVASTKCHRWTETITMSLHHGAAGNNEIHQYLCYYKLTL